MRGTVTWYNIVEGWGSFQTEKGQAIRFNRKVLPVGTFLNKGDFVEFDIKDSAKGPYATNVKKLN